MPEVLLKQLNQPASRFLVFTSAGKHARVQDWMRGRKRFDLWITCYAEEDASEDLKRLSDYYLERSGGKFPNLYFSYQNWPGIFQQDQAVFVMDDDLLISGSRISELFEVLLRYDLWLLQPAFSQFGKWSHPVTKARPFSYLRYSNFVEVTCPLFRMDKLIDFMSVYDSSLVGWGTDHWFMHHLIGDRRDKAAIVDAIIVVNPHDETKGRREILELQVDEEREAAWRHIQKTRSIPEVDPIREWSMIRRWDDWRFYTSSLITLYTKALVRIRHILGIDPTLHMD